MIIVRQFIHTVILTAKTYARLVKFEFNVGLYSRIFVCFRCVFAAIFQRTCTYSIFPLRPQDPTLKIKEYGYERQL